MVGFLMQFVSRFQAKHSWRKATFSEISALYIAKILRLLALNLLSAFILIYLFNSGHSLLFLAIFSAYRALICVIMVPLSAMLTSRFGAKKVILISNLLYVPAFLFYSDLSNDSWIALGGFLQSVAITFYQVAHDVIFSEVKSADNSGKEIGYMAIFEKITAVLSPLIGGILSVIASPITVIVVASLLFIASTWPLFRSQGVAKKHHRFNLEALPLRIYMREMLCQISPGFDSTVDKVWPLFLVVVVFANRNSYFITGITSSVAGLVAVMAAFVVGRLLDRNRRHGRIVFQSSSLLNAVAQLTKAFVNTPLASAVNIILAGSALTTRDISALKEQFLRADRSGSRVAYLMYRHLFWNIFVFIACMVWAVLMFYGDSIAGMQTFFIIAGICAAFYGFSGYWSSKYNIM